MPPKEWTVMIYMAGDNNLSEEMISALTAIEEGLTGPYTPPLPSGTDPADVDQVAFVAQFDCSHPIVGTRRYDKTMPSDEPVPLDELTTISVAIEKFVRWAVRKQPAKKYALILSGHSDAFMGRTLLLDSDPSSIITIPELKACLTACKPVLPSQRFDILGFDSCVMNTLEVINEFRGLADLWLGSQGSIPNYTWDYRNIARELRRTSKPDLSATRIVEIVTASLKGFNTKFAFGGRSMDISANRLTPGLLDPLLDMLDTLAGVLGELMFETTNYELVIPEFTRRYNAIQRLVLHNHWRSQTLMFDQTVDIRDFSSCLKRDAIKLAKETLELCGVGTDNLFQNEVLSEEEMVIIASFRDDTNNSEKARTQISNLLRLYLACRDVTVAAENVVLRGSYSGSQKQFSRGVSVFFPWAFLAYFMARDKYEALDFYSVRKNRWRDFILFQSLITSRFDPAQFPKEVAERIPGLGTEQLVDLLIELAGGKDNRDSPPHNRGLDEYYYYFGQIRNVLPVLDVSGDFQ